MSEWDLKQLLFLFAMQEWTLWSECQRVCVGVGVLGRRGGPDRDVSERERGPPPPPPHPPQVFLFVGGMQRVKLMTKCRAKLNFIS